MLNKLLIISLILTSSTVLADDLEIFKGRRTKDKPNVVFLMDASASMAFFAKLNKSKALPIPYDSKVRYPRVLGGYDPDEIYLANGGWMSSYNALENHLGGGANAFKQRDMQRYVTKISAIEGCAGIKQDLKNNGFWSHKQAGSGWNTRAKLWTSSKGWKAMPYGGTNVAQGGNHSDPQADDRIVCRDDNPINGPINYNGWLVWKRHESWSNAHIEKIATGNYLNYITAKEKNKEEFLYSRMSILQDAMYHALGKVKGINIGLARTDGKVRSANLLGDLKNIRGGGITIPLMPIESAQTVFDKEISTYIPNKFNALSEALYEVRSYLTGGQIKFANDMDYKVLGRTQDLWRHRGRLTFQNMRGNVTNYASLKDKNYQVPSAIKNNNTTYKMPNVKECTTSDVLVFSDGSDYHRGSIFESNSDVEANEDIVKLIKNINFPSGSFLYNYCQAVANQNSNLEDKFFSGQCLDELAYYMANKDQYPSIGTQGSDNEKQFIRVHTIGGFIGQDPNNLAYLKHVAKAGKGLFYKADNLEDMRNAIYNAIANTLSVTSSFTAPNVPVSTTNRLQESSDVYLPQFKPENLTNWIGNFKRYKLNDYNQIIDANNKLAINNNGFIKDDAQSIWSQGKDKDGKDVAIADGSDVAKGGMASRLSAGRNLWVNNGGSLVKFEDINDTDKRTLMKFKNANQGNDFNKVVKWAQGISVSPDANATEVDRKSMEDIIHSTPLLVNYENTADRTKPHQTIFVGSNSGFLHAFNPDKDSPSERYSFVPRSLFKNFKHYFFSEYSWVDKPYGLDGEITSWHTDTNRNGIIDNGEKAYLFVGMRRGGHSYYALDISNKDKPTLKWEIHGNYPSSTVNKPATTTGFQRLGQTWSPMIPAEVMWKGKKKIVLFIGGGYNPLEDGTTDTGPVNRINYSADLGNTLYMIDAETRTVLWDAKTHLSTTASANMRNSFPSQPVPIDRTGNGLVDMLYASDVGGRVWRFDFNQNHNTSDGSSNFAEGGVIADLGGNDANNRRFFNKPDISYYKGKSKPILISIGSGYRAHPLSEKVADEHFLIKDTLNKPSAYTALTTSDLVALETAKVTSIAKNETTASNTNASDSNLIKGWRIILVDQAKGEKVLSSSTTVKGQIFITTYSPSVASNAGNVANCIPKYGVARLYNVNIHTIGKKKVLVKELAQSGIPAQPAVLFNRKENANTGGGNGGGGNGGGGNGGGGNGGGGNSSGSARKNCENVGAVTMIGTEVVKNSLNRCGQVTPVYWREVDRP